MPVATPFNAIGAGNGFPECLTSEWDGGTVEVSHASHWTTLSGWSNVNAPDGEEAQEQSIIDSFKNAMKLFWNLYSINYTVEASSFWEGYGTSTTSLGNLLLDTKINTRNGVDLNGGDNYREARPLYRVCSPYGGDLLNRVVEDSLRPRVETDCSTHYYPRPISFGPDLPLISRMENNGVFVGYGIGSSYVPADEVNPAFYNGLLSWALADTVSPSVGLELSSVALPEPTGFYDDEIDYIELSGMHFVCRVNGFDGNTGVLTLEPSLGHAKVDRELKNGDGEVVRRDVAEISLDSLGFYTYPTNSTPIPLVV